MEVSASNHKFRNDNQMLKKDNIELMDDNYELRQMIVDRNIMI